MAHQTKSRRLAIWGTIVMLLLAWYMVSPPLVFPVAEKFAPTVIPGLRVFYAPLESYAVNDNRPGSRVYGTYTGRSVTVVKKALNPVDLNKKLLEPTEVEFSKTPLRDVLSYMSEMHGVAFELDASADGQKRVTVASRGTVQMILGELLEPHGLIAVLTGDKFVISTQQAFEQQRSESEATAAVRTRTVRTVIAGLSAITILAVWCLLRSARNRRNSSQ